MRFLARPQAAAKAPGACAWIVHRDRPGATVAGPTTADLADAAAVPAADGGAARLWRRRLLRTLAAHWLEVAPRDLVFERDAGAARIVAPRRCFVSAASRGVWSVVAVGRARIGVDLELAGAEIELYASARGIAPEAACRRWTATEACAKATGLELDATEALIEGLQGEPGRICGAGLPELEIAYAAFPGGLAAAAFPPEPVRA